MADNSTQPKVTYATLAAGQTPEFTRAYDEAAARVRKGLGKTHPHFIGGREISASETFESISPSDKRLVLGKFAKGTRDDAKAAIAAARKAYETTWRDMPWKERISYLRKAADAIEKHRYDLSALLGIEVGKNRLEAMGDVQETADMMKRHLHAAAVPDFPERTLHVHRLPVCGRGARHLHAGSRTRAD